MSQCATWFLEIHFAKAEQASNFANKWSSLVCWSGFRVCRLEPRKHACAVIVMVWGGKLKEGLLPSEVTRVVEHTMIGEFSNNKFEWPDWPRHPHLRSTTIFERRSGVELQRTGT